ncbi:MAG: glycosyltransferase [Gemmataceae bacterium]|nr:glycosyltransferase [Gemmataceae bacterium]
MRLVALVEAEDHVCCRYRLAAFRGPLATAGHTLDLRPLPRGWAGRLALGRDLAGYDAVIVQRKLLPRVPLGLLRRRVRRLIFDFDDAVWLRDSYSPKGFADPRRGRRFRAVAGAADLIVAGNDYLAAGARRFTTPDRVAVIPTCVDVGRYAVKTPLPNPLPAAGRGNRTTEPVLSPLSPRGRGLGGGVSSGRGVGSPLSLVWVGSSSTLRGLEQFRPTLSAVGKAVPGVRLKLICDRFMEVDHLPVERCPWDEATEPAEIAAADVGIGWVPDDPWSRGKCGLKVLQYQAAGLPVVANPVGVQAEFVRDGEAGFRATTTEEWVQAVRVLAADVGLRHRLGAEGRRRVEAGYSVAAGARMWCEALDRLARVRRAG